MQRYRRTTITYRGVKVRYSHLFIVVDGIEYTTTEIDERNLESIKRAYRKWNVKKVKGGWVLRSSLVEPEVQKALVNHYSQMQKEYDDMMDFMKQIVSKQRVTK